MSKTSNKVTKPYKNNIFSFEEKSGDNKIVLQIVGLNRYHSVYLPYSTYPSVFGVAKKVVDFVPGFSFARYLHGGRADHG
jgi:hypothetical protein